MKFVIFCNFFRIFWTPNGKKRLVHVAHMDQSRRATALSPASLSPRQCVAPLSPPSRLDARTNAGESGAISPALAGRECCRPLSPSRLPIASRGAVEGSSRLPSSPHCHQPKGGGPDFFLPYAQMRMTAGRFFYFFFLFFTENHGYF
jgi:hypothetical protein